jgi:hypothetical protein
MKNVCLLPVALLSVVGAAVAADEPFNGTQPMVCEPQTGHDCLPTEKSCKPLKGEPGKELKLHIDVQNMKLRTPFRTADLPIQSFSYNAKSLVLQGTASEQVWSATVHRTTGRLTVVIADREGAYVVFGQCKLEAAKPAQ